MVKISTGRRSVLAAAVLGIVGSSAAMGASATWSATPTDSNWALGANWSTGAVPGALNPGASGLSADVATFNTPIFGTIGDASNPILNDNFRQVRSFLFDTNAGAYTIGTVGGNQLWLGHSGNVTMNAGVTNAQTFNAPIQFRLPSSTNGVYSFVNNSTTTAATLKFNDITNTSAGTRPFTLTLDGTNTGLNTIGQIFDNAGLNGAILLVKNGAGTWVLAGANDLPQKTSAGNVASATINAGTLVVQNAGSLGALTAPNIRVVGTGTLKIDGGISLNNTGATLDGTGRILTNGSTTLNSLGVNATATDVTLETTSASDVFTAGATGNVTGGAAASNVHIAGPGTVVLNNPSTYLGSYSVDAGTLRVSNATGLGAATTASLKFGAASTGVVQLNGVNATVIGLQGTAAGSAVESAGGATTLTVNNTAANQYGGTLRDGAGQLSLTKSGLGVLALTGASTLTGPVTVTAGTLLANNASGSATGTGNTLTASGNAAVGGNGTIGSAVNLTPNARLAPGAAAGLVGTLSVNSLTLGTNTNLDYDITSAASLDQTIVTANNGLTIDGGQLNINGATSAFTTNGVYNLIGYTGTIGGTGISALSVNAINKNLATNSYTFGQAAGYVTLTIASSGTTISYWNTDSNSTWSAGPWTPSEPNSAGAFASFGGGGTAITANRTITVDAPKTVGTIAFNNGNSGNSYTITGNSITLNGSGVGGFITDTAGSHTIDSGLNLVETANTVTVSQAADVLTLGGPISGAGSAVTKVGAGTLALTGTNTYAGGTTLSLGTVRVNSNASLGDVSGAANFAGGTLQLLADVASARTYIANANDSDVKLDTNGFNLNHTGTIVASGGIGGVVKSGAGTLTLGGTNTYTGATTVNGGTLSVSSNANLGDAVAGSAVNLNNGSTLASTATFGLFNGVAGTNDRAVTVGSGGANVDVADTTSLTVSGLVSGNTLTKLNTGSLVLTNTGNTVPIVVSAGTLTAGGTVANTNGGLGNGAITLQNGTTLNSFMPAGRTLIFGNALTVAAGQTATLNTPGNFQWAGTLAGAGTLNVGVTTTVSRFDFNGNLTAFTGNLNLTGSGTARLTTNGGLFNGNSFQNLTLDLGGTVFLAPQTNTPGNTYPIGALSGTSTTAGLGGGTAGSPNYTIGGLNTSTTYAGLITGNAIVTKVGTGTLTLTNANGYSGLTNINAGTLAINGQFALGGAVYAGTTFNGGRLQYVASLPGTNGTADISQDSLGVAKPVTFAVNGATIDTNGNDVTYASSVGNIGAGGLTKTGTGKLTLTASAYNGVTTVNAGTLQLNAGAQAPVLTGTTGTEVQDSGKLLLNYAGGGSPVATVKGFLDTAYASNFSAGQIRSTGLLAGRTLGYGDNGVDTVTVRVTLPGDADLDGDVDFNDFLSLQTNFGATGTRFDQGNFNYDAATDFNDFLALQTNFGQNIGFGPVAFTSEQVAAITAFGLNPLNQAVPEPASLTLLGLGAAGLLRRRRR